MHAGMTVARAPQQDRGFVIVLPGGGYQALSPSEADPVCDWLAASGFSCGWLRYPVDPARHPGPLTTVLAAIAAAREHVDGPIALLGFSAGGHLAGLAATATPEEIEMVDGGAGHPVPDVVVLGYPVTSMHRRPMGSMGRSLLEGSGVEAASLSLENRVRPDCPPFFVWHTAADPSVPATESLTLAAALVEAGVPVELHLYPQGGHGLSVGRVHEVPRVAAWLGACESWLHEHGV